jgi:hypothetical protein
MLANAVEHCVSFFFFLILGTSCIVLSHGGQNLPVLTFTSSEREVYTGQVASLKPCSSNRINTRGLSGLLDSQPSAIAFPDFPLNKTLIFSCLLV